MYQPWVAHWYPGLTPNTMINLRWSTYIGMWDSLPKDGG